MDWDVFISHAWEDKEDIAGPLAEALRRKGLRVWYDEFTLTLGDSLRRSIDRGLAQSRYGVVILSPHFFAKEWTQYELDGLVTKEVSSGKTILPVWHNITREDVSRFSPTLADKLAVSTGKGLNAVVEEILRALRVPTPPVTPAPTRPRRPVNWKMVGAIAGVMAALIVLGAWLVPNAADWLFKTPTAIQTSSPTHTPAIPTATPAATPTFTPSPTPTPEQSTDTPMPIPTIPISVLPTHTPLPPTPTQSDILSCSIRPLEEFASLWEGNQHDLGCPVDNGTVVSPACEEAFEGGHLFWRSDTTRIYIVYDRDKSTGQELFSGDWFIGPEEWGWDRSNPNGIGLEPPPNRYEPIGGLGWLWREYLGREEGRLGWATSKEYCFEGQAKAQLYENGLIYKSSDSKIYALLYNDKFIASR